VEKFAIDYLGPVIDERLYQMSHSAKIVSAIFYEHALTAILAVSVIHAMKREHLAVSAMLAASVAHVIWRDSLAKIATFHCYVIEEGSGYFVHNFIYLI
jgi:hypothetical protein